MFDNIGGKIKSYAQIVCWIGIIGSIVSGLAMLGMTGGISFVIIIFGPIISWVSSFVLYGFGQIIENTDIIAKNINKGKHQEKQSNIIKVQTEKGKKDTNFTNQELIKAFKEANNIEEKDFLTEIKETSKEDLELILKEQRSLYTKEEISIIEDELKSRN